MNSNQAYQDMCDEKRVLAEKIKYQITSYKMRRLCAVNDIADISRILNQNRNDLDMVPVWQSRINHLLDERDFCTQQIDAYETGNDKMKIVPDRIL